MTRPQPLLIRITHLVSIPVLVVMVASGLEILAAFPYFGPQGEEWTWVPLHGWHAPAFLRAGSDLAGARHLHLLFAWIFVVNGLVYVAYRIARKVRPRPGHVACLVLGLFAVLSGFAVWKPVQLWWLAAMFGGYQGARVVHWLATLGLVVFVIVHVALALRRPRTIVEMVTGGERR